MSANFADMRHFTYANVIATLALVLALGGTGAYAAGLAKNSVGGKQIKNGSVAAKELKKGTLTGQQVLDGSLTGADVAAATLSKVPAAATVDTVQHLRRVLPATGGTSTLLTKGSLSLEVACALSPPAKAFLSIRTTANDAAYEAVVGATAVADWDFDVSTVLLVEATGFGLNAYRSLRLTASAADGTSLTVLGSVQAIGSSSCAVDLVVLG